MGSQARPWTPSPRSMAATNLVPLSRRCVTARARASTSGFSFLTRVEVNQLTPGPPLPVHCSHLPRHSLPPQSRGGIYNARGRLSALLLVMPNWAAVGHLITCAPYASTRMAVAEGIYARKEANASLMTMQGNSKCPAQ